MAASGYQTGAQRLEVAEQKSQVGACLLAGSINSKDAFGAGKGTQDSSDTPAPSPTTVAIGAENMAATQAPLGPSLSECG